MKSQVCANVIGINSQRQMVGLYFDNMYVLSLSLCPCKSTIGMFFFVESFWNHRVLIHMQVDSPINNAQMHILSCDVNYQYSSGNVAYHWKHRKDL